MVRPFAPRRKSDCDANFLVLRFLLKYASRDSVEVLARGTGGAADARGAVAQYDEKSPLYGFLLYRRRKVLIKYTPEGTSRLLQGRLAPNSTCSGC